MIDEILFHESIEDMIIIKGNSKLSFKQIYEELENKFEDIKKYFNKNKFSSEPYVININCLKLKYME